MAMSTKNREKSRVLVLTDSFPPCPYAASQRIGAFVEVIASNDVEAIVFTLFRCLTKKLRSTLDSTCPIFNFRYPDYLLRLSVVMVNPLLVLLFLFGATVIAATRHVKGILVSVPQGEVVIAGFLVSRLFGTPLIVDLRDWYPVPSVELRTHRIPRPRILNEILIKLFQAMYRRSQKLVCVDANIRRNILASGVSPSKVAVIPNGADTSTYKPCTLEERSKIRSNHGLSNDKVIFVYAGSLAKHYPVIDAIKGAESLFKKRNEFQLLIITFSDYTSHADYVRKIGLEEAVKFLGPLPAAETARLISACDVGVVTYGKEQIWQQTYGSKIFAYMSCGLPILASGSSGSVIEKLINEHELGYFVGSPTGKSFARGFLYFLDNKDKKILMGKNAREIVEKTYNRKKLALKMVDLIFSMVKCEETK